MSGKKMTGKQEVTGGFDLDTFVGAAEPAPRPMQPQDRPSTSDTTSERREGPSELPKAETRPNPQPISKKPPTARTAPQTKPADERLGERVQILVSPAELAAIKKKAGLVSVSKFLRQHLKDSGLI